MTDSILEASLTIEYCALQIAKLIERSKIEQFNSQLQFSPSEITNILNALPSGMNMDFHVNASAIHQGIHHLKKSLTRREFSCVEMFPYDDRIPKFFELEENLRKGYHLKFPIVIVGDENRSIDDLSADVASTRDDMFKLHRYKQSKYLKGFYIYNEFLKGPIKDCDDYKKISSNICSSKIYNKKIFRNCHVMMWCCRTTSQKAPFFKENREGYGIHLSQHSSFLKSLNSVLIISISLEIERV